MTDGDVGVLEVTTELEWATSATLKVIADAAQIDSAAVSKNADII